ncbi:hypothetical protein GCM10023220_44070 [Streptomyces ziwulingensis]|uniref:DUF397 domain-containing protein n=2 Tax=Streptomyces ziwulingensis TaxID=1045501 RepID=A0ABP9CD94_9ACTN
MLPYVEVQVMPTDRDGHAGTAGSMRLPRLRDGKIVGHSEGQLHSRLINDIEKSAGATHTARPHLTVTDTSWAAFTRTVASPGRPAQFMIRWCPARQGTE